MYDMIRSGYVLYDRSGVSSVYMSQLVVQPIHRIYIYPTNEHLFPLARSTVFLSFLVNDSHRVYPSPKSPITYPTRPPAPNHLPYPPSSTTPSLNLFTPRERKQTNVNRIFFIFISLTCFCYKSCILYRTKERKRGEDADVRTNTAPTLRPSPTPKQSKEKKREEKKAQSQRQSSGRQYFFYSVAARNMIRHTRYRLS